MKKTGRSFLFAFGTASLLPILFIGILLTVRMRKMAYEQSLKEAKQRLPVLKAGLRKHFNSFILLRMLLYLMRKLKQ